MADDVKKLLSEYIAEHRAGGEADPVAFVERAQGADRNELAALIDAYLERSPGRDWDPAAYQGSEAERVADELGRSLLGTAGLWPTILPRLRKQARLTRGQVVERLSAALGAKGREEKVGGYYHGMEHGTLESSGVSERVLAALGEIYGTSAEKLREFGEPLGGGGLGDAPVMARLAKIDPDYAGAPLEAPAADRAAPVAPAGDLDEIDELFTGGP